MTQRRQRDTPHAEGQHGPQTHKRLAEQLESGPSPEPTEATLESDHRRAALEGKRRLVADREQHDEAEKNSEQNRLDERNK